MKISEIKTYVTWGDPRNWVFVKVCTDSGIHGWGEGTLEGREQTVVAAVKDISPALVGADPLASEHNWQVLYRHGFVRGGVILNSALAAIDQALWDIRGKAWGVPVYKLLGGPTRSRLRLYTHVGVYEPDKLIDEAEEAVAAGFTALKTGAWPKDALLSDAELVTTIQERIAELRSAVGNGIDILLDNHGRSRPTLSVRIMEALRPYKMFWIEEPTPPDDLPALKQLRLAQPQMDLAFGERLYSKWDFLPLLESRLVDYLQPDLCHAGGITECKKIAAIAEAYSVQIAPHNPQGPLSTAAAAHLALAIPNFAILEFLRSAPFRDLIVKEPWTIENGVMEVPDRPGLGVELIEDALEANPPRPVGVPTYAWHWDGSVADV